MSQSTVIALGILFGFLAYITVRGELPAYISVFIGAEQKVPAPVTAGSAALGTATSGLNALGLPGAFQSSQGGFNSPSISTVQGSTNLDPGNFDEDFSSAGSSGFSGLTTAIGS